MSTTLDPVAIAFAGAARQAALVAGGELSARELTELHLERIARLDPQLNAFRVVLAEQALAEADAADERRARGEGGPLNGVPVAIKDDTDVAGQSTPFGTGANGGIKGADSAMVARLRDAGAVVLGKTNVPELMICCFTETLSYGATRNPWDPTRTPGGSSGGAGAAVAAGLCGVAHGSDGAGSIRIPAAWCGLFGLKPQRDRVPMAPYDGAWNGLSTNGPIGRTVADAAVFLDATAATGTTFADAAARPAGPLRIAMATNLPPGILAKPSADALRAVHETAEHLRALGHTVTETTVDFGPAAGPSVTARYLAGIAQGLRDLEAPERVERRTRGFARLGAAIPQALVDKATAAGVGIGARIGRVFEHADVLLTPGPAKPPFAVGALQGRGALWTMNAMLDRVPYYATYNATGQPAASVPAGFDADGLPLAVQLVGRPDDEATLLSVAAGLEQVRPLGPPAPGGLVSAAEPDDAELLRVAEAAARAAAPELVERFTRGAVNVTSKSTETDLVSEADLAAERTIRALLAAERPDDAIMGEEGDDTPGTTGLRWVVDPLDGTINYLYGLPQWCVSVACEGRAGVVFDPLGDELWAVSAGATATCNGEPLPASSRPDSLGGALVATGFGYAADVRAAQADVLTRVLPAVRDIRRAGSAALDLAWVAAGRLDAYYEFGVKPWDIAAGALLCEAAGLRVTPLAGGGGLPPGILAAPPALHDALLALVRR